jgi:hypothetical protein
VSAAVIGVACSIIMVTLAVIAFLIDRWLKPRRERKTAEAEERQLVAKFASEKMQAAFNVLVGQDPDPAQGVEGTPGLGKRVAQVEAQLRTNGGNSARDILEEIHAVALENREANTRMEAEQRRAAVLAGDAATLAGTADQRIRELGEIATARHQDNTHRLERLEDAAREERIRREFYLATLRELYGIELEDPS